MGGSLVIVSVGFSIGEVSRAVGVAPQTVRLWEREGLIEPGRTERGYRVYSEADVERLRRIKHQRKTEGLNFAAIRKQLGPAATAPHSDRTAGSDGGRATGVLEERLRRLRTRAHKTLKSVFGKGEG
jgi:DNA-binding transcriptional MerR regulator